MLILEGGLGLIHLTTSYEPLPQVSDTSCSILTESMCIDVVCHLPVQQSL